MGTNSLMLKLSDNFSPHSLALVGIIFAIDTDVVGAGLRP